LVHGKRQVTYHEYRDCLREHGIEDDSYSAPKRGSGYLERKSSGELVYHTPWLKKPAPFKLAAVKANQETPEKAFARLLKAFKTDDTSKHCMSVIGADCGDGFKIAATNGHWAICEKGQGSSSTHSVASAKDHKRVLLTNSELHNAVKRAETAADKRSHYVGLVGLETGIGVYASTSDEVEFTEIVDGPAGSDWHFGVNVEYLEPVLGVWPMALYVHKKEPDSYAIMLEPADNPQWRFVLMPYRGDSLKDAQAKFKGYAEEII
jgi:DNA polymerase III sliding clamp (beta) subunit (PCNA family)